MPKFIATLLSVIFNLDNSNRYFVIEGNFKRVLTFNELIKNIWKIKNRIHDDDTVFLCTNNSIEWVCIYLTCILYKIKLHIVSHEIHSAALVAEYRAERGTVLFVNNTMYREIRNLNLHLEPQLIPVELLITTNEDEERSTYMIAISSAVRHEITAVWSYSNVNGTNKYYHQLESNLNKWLETKCIINESQIIVSVPFDKYVVQTVLTSLMLNGKLWIQEDNTPDEMIHSIVTPSVVLTTYNDFSDTLNLLLKKRFKLSWWLIGYNIPLIHKVLLNRLKRAFIKEYGGNKDLVLYVLDKFNPIYQYQLNLAVEANLPILFHPIKKEDLNGKLTMSSLSSYLKLLKYVEDCRVVTFNNRNLLLIKIDRILAESNNKTYQELAEYFTNCLAQVNNILKDSLKLDKIGILPENIGFNNIIEIKEYLSK